MVAIVSALAERIEQLDVSKDVELSNLLHQFASLDSIVKLEDLGFSPSDFLLRMKEVLDYGCRFEESANLSSSFAYGICNFKSLAKVRRLY